MGGGYEKGDEIKKTRGAENKETRGRIRSKGGWFEGERKEQGRERE